ncbi:MAG: hypothetical protein HC828_10750 [Blastochloris sp.]|nr:hypothetical protein [Blastochloris sp.]
MEKQSLRRQVIEAQQMVEGLHEVLRDHNTRIEHVDTRHQRLELVVETLPPQISEIAAQLGTTTSEIKRVETAASDWFMLNQERLEDLRQQNNERFDELRDTEERHLQQLTAWLERLDGWARDLEQRLGRSVNRLETDYQEHVARIADLERREVQTLHTIITTLRDRVEKIANETTGNATLSRTD